MTENDPNKNLGHIRPWELDQEMWQALLEEVRPPYWLLARRDEEYETDSVCVVRVDGETVLVKRLMWGGRTIARSADQLRLVARANIMSMSDEEDDD